MIPSIHVRLHYAHCTVERKRWRLSPNSDALANRSEKSEDEPKTIQNNITPPQRVSSLAQNEWSGKRAGAHNGPFELWLKMVVWLQRLCCVNLGCFSWYTQCSMHHSSRFVVSRDTHAHYYCDLRTHERAYPHEISGGCGTPVPQTSLGQNDVLDATSLCMWKLRVFSTFVSSTSTHQNLFVARWASTNAHSLVFIPTLACCRLFRQQELRYKRAMSKSWIQRCTCDSAAILKSALKQRPFNDAPWRFKLTTKSYEGVFPVRQPRTLQRCDYSLSNKEVSGFSLAAFVHTRNVRTGMKISTLEHCKQLNAEDLELNWMEALYPESLIRLHLKT